MIGSRLVSTLTPEKLAHKRAKDCQAQRAIRARRKEYIEDLERQLRDLKHRNRKLEEELERRREPMGIISPVSNCKSYPVFPKEVPKTIFLFLYFLYSSYFTVLCYDYLY